MLACSAVHPHAPALAMLATLGSDGPAPTKVALGARLASPGAGVAVLSTDRETQQRSSDETDRSADTPGNRPRDRPVQSAAVHPAAERERAVLRAVLCCGACVYLQCVLLCAARKELLLTNGTDQIRYRRSKYFLVLVIGTYCEAIGLALRIAFRNDVHSLGGYIAMYMFVILSPCAFLAADYILLGRIVEYLDGARYLLLPPGKVSWTFVISDSELNAGAGAGVCALGWPRSRRSLHWHARRAR